MSFAYPLVGLITLICVAIFMGLGIKVGQGRAKHDVKLPATQGPDDWMRMQRAHGNTLEGLVMFFPALWLFAVCWGDVPAAVVGVFYPIGRILYARGYYEAVEKRVPGFTIGFFSTAILWVGGMVGLIMQVLGM